MGAPKNKIVSDEVMEAVIADLYTAQSLKRALQIHGVTAHCFFETLKQVPLHSEAYSRAQSSRADIFVDEITDIADNELDANKARNMMNARMWVASKMKPQVYGDKLAIDLNQNVDIRIALDEANNRIRNVLQVPTPQLIESTITIPVDATGVKPVASIESPPLLSIDDLIK